MRKGGCVALTLDAFGFLRQLVAVVPQEQLLEGGWMADEAAHPKLAEPAHRHVEVIRVDGEADKMAVDLEAVNTLEVGQACRWMLGLRRDRGTCEVSQLAERAPLHHPPQPDDAHAVTQRLDLGQDVTGKQHRSPLLLQLADAVLEHRLHQRVESRS